MQFIIEFTSLEEIFATSFQDVSLASYFKQLDYLIICVKSAINYSSLQQP